MRLDGITITFDSGRMHTAWYGIVGLGTDGLISVGYDARIVQASPPGEYVPRDDDPTRYELIELSEIMIARWTALRNRLR